LPSALDHVRENVGGEDYHSEKFRVITHDAVVQLKELASRNLATDRIDPETFERNASGVGRYEITDLWPLFNTGHNAPLD